MRNESDAPESRDRLTDDAVTALPGTRPARLAALVAVACVTLLLSTARLPAQTGATPASDQSQPGAQQEPPRFTARTSEVLVLFRALDRTLVPVTGLEPKDIRILDNGKPVQIRYFESGVAFSHVVVLADVSGSMGTVIEELQGGLYTLADMLSRDPEHQAGDILFSLIPFSDRAVVLVDRSSNAYEFKQGVARLQTMGTTGLVDAVIATLRIAFADKSSASGDPAASRSLRGRRTQFLVLFTDAGENASRHNWSEIRSVLQRTDVVVYSIALDSGSQDSNFSKLSEISARSGGRMLLARADDLNQVYRQVATDIRSHYLATFTAPDDVDPTQWRTIALTTSRPGVAIFTRKGYCPNEDVPCQLPDGSFAERGELTWDEFVDANRNPALIAVLKERLRSLRLGVSPTTSRIAHELATDTLLVERRRSPHRNGFSFADRWMSESRTQTDIDAEVCGFRVADEIAVPGTNVVSESVPDTHGRQELVVMSPDFRLAQGPRFTREQAQTSVPGERRHQAEVQFRLKDPTGRIASEIRVLCRRPRHLVNEDLVELAIRATEHALQTTVRAQQQ